MPRRCWRTAARLALIVLGFVLGAVHLSFHGNWLEKLRKGAGIAFVVGGAFAVWSYVLTPDAKLPYEHVEAEAFAKARAEHKGVMVDFSATWCVPCGELEVTFGDPEVYDRITKNFVPLKFDVSDGTDANEALQKRYGAGTLPAVVFKSAEEVEANRKEVGRINQMMKPEPMVKLLDDAIAALRAGNILASGDCKK